MMVAPPVEILHGDSLELLATIDTDSIDACVTDPPYGLRFMGKTWDTGEVAFNVAFWAEVLRVLKPGAHVFAFGASRGYHRMACAIEDAGFEIRDSFMWIYGTGFPKSHDVSKGIDKAAGAEREVIGVRTFADGTTARRTAGSAGVPDSGAAGQALLTAPEWEGWGTALKPAFEPIVLARKPLSEGTVAANVLRWRTGALNIKACRVETTENLNGGAYSGGAKNLADATSYATGVNAGVFTQPTGRWPANVVTDGSDEVVAAFPVTGPAKAGKRNAPKVGGTFGDYAGDDADRFGHSDNGGSAARFFYSAKASKADRAGSKHPTVKPIALMQWLARLITPPGGTVLDPFAGSGTTGAACAAEGFNCILIEREAEYVADIRRRLEHRHPEREPQPELMGLFA